MYTIPHYERFFSVGMEMQSEMGKIKRILMKFFLVQIPDKESNFVGMF